MDASNTTVALMCVTTSVATFTSLMPDMSDVRKASPNSDIRNDVKMGEMTSAVVVIGIGLLGAFLVKSPIPAMASVVAIAGLCVMYEIVLATNPKEIAHV